MWTCRLPQALAKVDKHNKTLNKGSVRVCGGGDGGQTGKGVIVNSLRHYICISISIKYSQRVTWLWAQWDGM